MTIIPNLLDHTGFTVDNRSNFDIDESSYTDRLLEVPVFPAQNTVIDTPTVNMYEKQEHILQFIWGNKLYSLISPDLEQRFTLIRYGFQSREMVYRYGGRIYCQSRTNAAFALDPDGLYVFGGKDENRGRRELWNLNMSLLTWTPLHPVGEDTSLSDFPAPRWDTSLVVGPPGTYIFGGQTYSEIGNTDITLNDLWWKDGDDWKILDNNALLPRAEGMVVYADASVVKVVADGLVYSVSKVDDSVTSTTLTSTAISLDSLYYTAYMDGSFHFVTKNGVFSWNNTTDSYDKVDGNTSIGMDESYNYIRYSVDSTDRKRRGQGSEYQPYFSSYRPRIHDKADDSVTEDCDIGIAPLGKYMASTDIEGGFKFLGLGIQEGVFNEDHFIWDGNTNHTRKVNSGGLKPQERLAASCCYDAARERIWLFGGYSGSFYYNDLWYLDLTTDNWVRVKERVGKLYDDISGAKIWPGTRARAGICVVEDSLWLISGYSDQSSYADMWEYKISTGVATEVKTTDWVPFGTDYHIFTWRDRMWMFNGEKYKLYRYFYELKQWVPVVIYESRDLTEKTATYRAKENIQRIADDASALNNEKDHLPNKSAYLSIREAQLEDAIKAAGKGASSSEDAGISFFLAPMRIAVQDNKLIISHTGTAGMESFFIDMENKEMIQYPGSIHNASLWKSGTVGMDTSGYLYHYNVSTFEMAEVNQVPYFEYSADPLSSGYPTARTSNLMTYFDGDTVGGVTERLVYLDAGNMYVLYNDEVNYSPLLPTSSEMKDGLWGQYWPQYDFAVLDGTTGAEQEQSKIDMGTGRFRTVPRFVWQRIPPRYADKLRKASMSWKDETSQRTYIANNESGQIIRFRSKDGTSLTYPAKVWKESAISRRGNVVFAFGGSLLGGPPARDQNGEVPSYYNNAGAQDWQYVLDSHNGLMMYDLDYIGFQARMLSEYEDLTPFDYDSMKDYLINIANAQGITRDGSMPADWLEDITNTLYSNTIDLLGSMAARNIVGESGTRPPWPRSGMQSIQLGSNMYVCGGAHKYYNVVRDESKIPPYTIYSHYTSGYVETTETLNEETKEVKEVSVYHPYGDLYVFDTSTKNWTQLADMPVNVYGGSLLATDDETILYLVGGYLGDDLTEPSNRIFKYLIDTDEWSEVLPLPTGYKGRGAPICDWIDKDNMIIMFGNRPIQKEDEYIKIPVADSWVFDTRNMIMYKMFSNHSKVSVVENGLTDGSGWVDMIDYYQPLLHKFYNELGLNSSLNTIHSAGTELDTLNENDAVTSNSLELEWGTSSIEEDPSITWNRIDPLDGSVKASYKVILPGAQSDYFVPTNILCVFRDWMGGPWFILNTGDGSAPSIYRWAKIDEYTYETNFFPVDMPVTAAAHLCAYDGQGKLYFIWNEFNIWEMDLKMAVSNPNGEYWRMLPPNPDLVDIGLIFTDGMTSALKSCIAYNGDLMFYGSNGSVYRFNTVSYKWYVDRMPRTSNWSYTTAVVDGNEMYYFEPGETRGTWYSIPHKQSDKFYFDAELLESKVELPLFAAMGDSIPSDDNGPLAGLMEKVNAMLGVPQATLNYEEMAAFVEPRRSTVRRNRLLAWNQNNHLMRAWSRKHGEVDLVFEFDRYYPCSRIDLSVDYDTMSQASNFNIEVLTKDGWFTDTCSPVQEETGYDYDAFSMRYVKQIILPNGSYTYVASKRPGYYVRMMLASNTAIKAMKIHYLPDAKEGNYISRINHIFAVSEADSLSFEDDSGVIEVMHIEPFEDSESDTYTVSIRNTHGTEAAQNIGIGLVKNFRVLISLNGVDWQRPDASQPVIVADSLSPGQNTSFYLKAVSYFDKSNIELVISADYPLPA